MAKKAQDFDELAKAFEFGSTYPVTSVQSQPASASYGDAPTSRLQQLVTQALQGVLGRSFKPGDYRSFKAALEVSFEYKQGEGQPVYEWKPRAYPAVGATDIGGGVSGAQYSLVSFARGLHEQSQPLIENLHSLLPDVDEENLEAAKAIFTTAWDEFIDELAREGGPRGSRANLLSLSIFDPDKRIGHLVRLGELLGTVKLSKGKAEVTAGRIDISRDNVVTSEEEGYLTSFIALADYYFAVNSSWDFYFKSFFMERRDLGGRLLDIERQLAVIEDGVNEVFVAMDSVNIDQGERLVTIINFTDENAATQVNNLSVEDFLSWIASFASREAPQLIRAAGKLGIQAVAPTAKTLHGLTEQLADKCQEIRDMEGDQSESGLPQQFGHARVINPLRELERYLQRLTESAESEF
jgi:hypothetical protein